MVVGADICVSSGCRSQGGISAVLRLLSWAMRSCVTLLSWVRGVPPSSPIVESRSRGTPRTARLVGPGSGRDGCSGVACKDDAATWWWLGNCPRMSGQPLLLPSRPEPRSYHCFPLTGVWFADHPFTQGQ